MSEKEMLIERVNKAIDRLPSFQGYSNDWQVSFDGGYYMLLETAVFGEYQTRHDVVANTIVRKFENNDYRMVYESSIDRDNKVVLVFSVFQRVSF